MYNKLIRSSQSPEQLAMTVRGILVSLIPLAMFFFGIGQEAAQDFADVLVNLVFLLSSVFSTVLVAIGLIRKAANKRWSAPDTE